MIEKIHISSVATYDNDGVTFDNLQKINFIYGGNGSGKTTISNFLMNPSSPLFASCSIEWKDESLPILVYNKAFREANFAVGKIKGVFTLGQATREDLEKIEANKKELADSIEVEHRFTASLDKLSNDLQYHIDSFKELVWNQIYRKYENSLKEVFRGFMLKQKFVDKLLQGSVNPITQSDTTIEDIIERYKTLFLKENAIELSNIPSLPVNQLTSIESNQLWRSKIIGAEDVQIGQLIKHLNMSDWVNAGRSFIQPNSNICPFCQNETISNELKKQLNDFFDGSYTESISTLRILSDNYHIEFESTKSFIRSVLNQEKANSNTKLNIEEFEKAVIALESLLSRNLNIINNKLLEPSRSVTLEDSSTLLSNITEIIDSANTSIKRHNQLIENINNEKATVVTLAWQFFRNSYKQEIETYLKRQQGLQNGIKNITIKRNNQRIASAKLKVEIEELSKNITSAQPAIDEINRILNAYGITGFHIQPYENDTNQYQICRSDGAMALTTLSEGEVTFITFLYFLQLAKGSLDQNNITHNRILVIDDPISSLDSSILFVVSSLVKELIKKIKKGDSYIRQLILLTHNVYFHKEVSFIDGRTQNNATTHYWILRKANNLTSLTAYEQANPINSSYELLWREVRQRDKHSIITIQNVMRRIIENYFKILGKYGDDDLIKHFPTFEDQEICRSLLCWINDGSHCVPDDLYLEAQEGTIDKYYAVFKGIFEHTNHKAHYDMMMNANI